MARSVKFLQCKNEVLHLDPQGPHKNLGLVVHVYSVHCEENSQQSSQPQKKGKHLQTVFSQEKNHAKITISAELQQSKQHGNKDQLTGQWSRIENPELSPYAHNI